MCRHCTGCWVCTEISTEHLLCAGTSLGAECVQKCPVSTYRVQALCWVCTEVPPSVQWGRNPCQEEALSPQDEGHVLCCGGVTNPHPDMALEQELLDFGFWEFGELCSFHREDDGGPGEGRLCLTSRIQIFLHLSPETASPDRGRSQWQCKPIPHSQATRQTFPCRH